MSAKKRAGQFLGLLLILVLAACSRQTEPASQDKTQGQTQVLFIGNSHTFVNDVPGMFESMALAAGHQVNAEMVAHGGWTLLDHVQSPETIQMIRSAEWDFVVLQEQSDIPSFTYNREQEMYPSIRGLYREISARGADTVLFMTWGHRDGSIVESVGGYISESSLLETAYVTIGDELGVVIAPVGVAWWSAMQNAPSLALWEEDGNHATLEGSYLAASVLYHVILGQSPEGNSYTAGIAVDWALFYQKVASATILANPRRWNFP
ncbi:MAG: DUF4886 domain-containing protein [Anaerolineales bacterium]